MLQVERKYLMVTLWSLYNTTHLQLFLRTSAKCKYIFKEGDIWQLNKSIFSNMFNIFVKDLYNIWASFLVIDIFPIIVDILV